MLNTLNGIKVYKVKSLDLMNVRFYGDSQFELYFVTVNNSH